MSTLRAMLKMSFVLLASLLLLSACGMFARPKAAGTSSPVIEAYYASPTATWGGAWRLYMKAFDPDGDISEAIFYIKDQAGVMYPSFEGYLHLPSAMWKSFNGYFYLLIPYYFDVLSENMTMTVQLVDAGGRKSRMLELPLKIVSGRQTDSVPEGFNDVALQPIPIRIRTVDHDNPW